VSKRPKTAGSFLSRLRRPASRLRDMPIWSKLGLIMIVPTIATVVVGTSGLVDHLGTLNNANRAGDLANLAGYSGDLVNSLQDERTMAALLVAADRKSPEGERYAKAYTEVHRRVDEAKVPYSQQRAEIDDLPAKFENLLDRIDQNLTDLPGTRSQVFNANLGLFGRSRPTSPDRRPAGHPRLGHPARRRQRPQRADARAAAVARTC
jgi:hypothetical protein